MFDFVSPVRRYSQITAFLLGVLSVFAVSAALDISSELLSRIQSKYGVEASTRVEQWQHLMQTAQNLPEKEKLKQVNDFFNQRIEFVDDIYLWGVNDYWATPIEFLSKGAGDCEDYSIAKYFTLKELGVSESKMRITYVKALKLNQAHMVLTYFSSPRAVPIVLDNLTPQIKLATDRKDLLPVYSFNGSGLWLAKARGSGKRVGSSGRLNLWAELKQR
ncbi:MAG: sulfate adenylyltransferase, partial [Methylomarinum sp.]|nr:sulfate adenylyltransferase [Methylomarinum sp.]